MSEGMSIYTQTRGTGDEMDLLVDGGRPMERLERIGFRDMVNGEEVRFYQDKFGRFWMATHKWALFRVEAK